MAGVCQALWKLLKNMGGGTFKCQDEGDKFTVNIMLFFEIVEN